MLADGALRLTRCYACRKTLPFELQYGQTATQIVIELRKMLHKRLDSIARLVASH